MDNSKDTWQAKLQQAQETKKQLHISMSDGVRLEGYITKVGEDYIEFAYKEGKTYTKYMLIQLKH